MGARLPVTASGTWVMRVMSKNFTRSPLHGLGTPQLARAEAAPHSCSRCGRGRGGGRACGGRSRAGPARGAPRRRAAPEDGVHRPSPGACRTRSRRPAAVTEHGWGHLAYREVVVSSRGPGRPGSSAGGSCRRPGIRSSGCRAARPRDAARADQRIAGRWVLLRLVSTFGAGSPLAGRSVDEVDLLPCRVDRFPRISTCRAHARTRPSLSLCVGTREVTASRSRFDAVGPLVTRTRTR